MSTSRTNGKVPQYIKNAVRRRARAAEEWNLADDRISAYCERLGLDTAFVNKNVETLFRYFDPEFFIRDLEAALEKKHKKE